MPFFPIASCSLFNTQNPGNAYQNDLLKSSTSLVFIEYLFYYNQRLLSIILFLDYHRKSSQFTTSKSLVDLPAEVIKSVKSNRYFFSIFFDKKEKQHPWLTDFTQKNSDKFRLELQYNSDIFCFLFFYTAIIFTGCVNFAEPAALLGFPVKIKVVERIQPESTAAGLLFGWGGKLVGMMGHDCMVARLLGNFLTVNCQLLIVKY